jgi:hypothetical protein
MRLWVQFPVLKKKKNFPTLEESEDEFRDPRRACTLQLESREEEEELSLQ